MPCSKCCSTDKTPKEFTQSDSDVSVEREEILLPSNRNGRVSHYGQINQQSPGEKAIESETEDDYGKRKIRELGQYYITHCTLHGFHYVFETRSVLRKVMWLTILACAGGFFFQEVKASLYQYYQFPFTTMSTIEYPRKMPYPAVTICDFHDVRKSLDFTTSSQLVNVIDTSLEQFNNTLLSCTQKRGYFKRPVQFTTKDFDIFYSSKGQTCYTFNSGKHGKRVQYGDNIGHKYGLEFILNVQHPANSDVRETGFRFILHQQDDLPLTREGFRVSPGYVTYVDLSLTKEKNLGHPYKTNCGGKVLKYFKEYSRSNCYLEMLTDHVIRECNCRSWFMPAIPDVSTCTVQAMVDCMWISWDAFDRNKSSQSCSEDCKKSTYHSKLSSALFLPQKLLPLKQRHSYLMKAKHIPNDTKGILEFMKDNYVVVILYFDDLRLDIVEQQASYGFYRLVGDVGGQLGLVLGASFITLLEIIDLAVMWLYFWLKGKARRRSSKRKKIKIQQDG